MTLLKNGEEKEFQTEEMAVPGIAGYWRNKEASVVGHWMPAAGRGEEFGFAVRSQTLKGLSEQ